MADEATQLDREPRQAVLDCWYLTGPTASGKTQVGLELARRLNAEIISMDSMAIYEGMDIGTAKPSARQREQVRHHLIDIRQPTQEFSLSEYVEAAHDLIREIRQRGKEVLFVGGTPLYLKAMVRGVYEGPAADWDFRRQVEEEVERVGLEALRERLMQVDPLSAAKLHPNDKRRMIRALEVYKLTGRPISHQQTHFERGRPAEECRVFAIQWKREELHRRINARVDAMFDLGLVEEAKGLIGRFGRLSRTAEQAVGYREVLQLLAGERTREETVEKVKSRTRQFARRQETWFRHLGECRSVHAEGEIDAGQKASEIVSQVQSAPGDAAN